MTDTPAKPTKSPAIAMFEAGVKRHRAEEAPRLAALSKSLKARLDAWPNGFDRPEVFCWLWNNYAKVEKLHQERGWELIALLAEEDGVKGRWDKPPTTNSIRRVWHRMCRKKEKMEEFKAVWKEMRRKR